MAHAALSSTRLSLLRECPRAYHARYVEHRKGRATSGMRRGSLVHLCLERAAKARLDQGSGVACGSPADLDELLAYLDHYTSTGSYPSVAIREARNVLELCAPLDLAHVRHVEEDWRISARDGRTCMTKLDRVDWHATHYTPETGMRGETVLVYDYKTGPVETREALREKPATLLYLAAAREKYPSAHVGMVYLYLARGFPHYPIWWDEDLDRQARGAIEEALAELDRRSNGLDGWGEIAADPWPATAGSHCGTCPYTSGCDGFAELMRSLRTDVPEPFLLSIDELLREYTRARDASKANIARKQECGRVLRELIGTGKEVAGEELRARLVTTSENLLDAHAAAQAIAAACTEKGYLLTTQEQDIVETIAPRAISSRRLGDFLAKLPKEVRVAAKKAIEASKIPVDAGSYVRVDAFKNLFAVGADADAPADTEGSDDA